eukprot:jgi/Psemu1/41661/gm1.41661_g
MEHNKGRSDRAERARRRQNNKAADRQRTERAERARRRSQNNEGCARRRQQRADSRATRQLTTLASEQQRKEEFKEDDTDVTPEMQEVGREFQLLEDIVGPPENFGLSTGNTAGLKVEQLDNAVDQPDITGEDKKKNKTADSDNEVSSTSSSSSSLSDSSGSDGDSNSNSDSDRDSDDSSETVYHKEPDTRNKWASSVICHWCHEKGHKAFQYPHRQVICYWCQEKGHKAFQCPLRLAYHPKVASRPNNGRNNGRNNGSNNGSNIGSNSKSSKSSIEHCGICGGRHAAKHCWEDEKNAKKRPRKWKSKLKGIQGATIKMATTVFDLYL